MHRDDAQRAIKAGPNHPDYDEAIQHAHAHYKGLLRGAERQQAMKRAAAGGMGGGASSSSHCALTALVLFVLALGWPVAVVSWIGGVIA